MEDQITLENKAYLAYQAGAYDEAARLFKELDTASPKNPKTLLALGVSFAQLNQLQEARQTLAASIALDSKNAETLFNYANVCRALGEIEEAMHAYESALLIRSKHAPTLNNYALLLQSLCRYEHAVENFCNAISVDALNTVYLSNLSQLLQAINKHGEALPFLQHLNKLRPDDENIQLRIATSLIELEKYSEAQIHLNNALAINSDKKTMAFVLFLRGSALQKAGYPKAAIPNYKESLRLTPKLADVSYNLGICYCETSDYKKGIKHLQDAMRLQETPQTLSSLVYFRNRICNWSKRKQNIDLLKNYITDHKVSIAPFTLSTLIDDPELIYRSATLHWKQKNIYESRIPKITRKDVPKKIVIGFFSADFHDHATSQLMVKFIETIDRKNFQVIGLSYGSPRNDNMKTRISRAFDQFHELKSLKTADLVNKSKELKIDVAIDVKGFTFQSKHEIFSHRLAPVQISYLAYPGTSGAPWIDYLIADRTIITEDVRSFYCEKIIYMPDTYQPNDSGRKIGRLQLSRADIGLTAEHFIFGCLNNSYKISPEIFAVWIKILKRTERSVLWLLEDNPECKKNLRNEAKKRGLDPDRLIFSQRILPKDHICRFKLIDLFIDTYPYGAHTTASEALWMGCPVVTLVGHGFPSRVAASLLKAINLSELIVENYEDYFNLCVQLAGNRGQLSEIKKRLIKSKKTAPLFDTNKYTNHFEDAMRRVVTLSRAQKPPEDIFL